MHSYKSLPILALGLLLSGGAAAAEDKNEPSTIDKARDSTARAAKSTEAALGRAAKSTGTALEHAADSTGKFTKKAADATGSAFCRGMAKVGLKRSDCAAPAKAEPKAGPRPAP